MASQKVTLKKVIDADLLNEKYFTTEEQKAEEKLQLDTLISYAIMVKNPPIYEDDKNELYGPLLKDKLQSSDFTKLDYKSYHTKMQSFVLENLSNESFSSYVELFQDLQRYSEKLLEIESAELREYYFLDAEFSERDKLNEVNWYDYFFIVISILEGSDEVLIMNFGAS